MRLPPSSALPPEQQDVVLVDSGFDVPGDLRHLADELGERLADAVLATLDAGRGDEDGVVAVVGDDLLQVLGGQRLRVVVEDLLGARVAAMRPPPLPYRRGRPDLLISTEDKAAHKGRSLAVDVGGDDA
jgi:hypothetical protein